MLKTDTHLQSDTEMENKQSNQALEMSSTNQHNISCLFFTLEFVDPIFSGNGIHSRTIVEALLRGGCNHIQVVCGIAIAQQNTNNNTTTLFSGNDYLQSAHREGRLAVTTLPLSTWGHVSRIGPWEEYGISTINKASSIVSQFYATTKANGTERRCVLGVDWSSWQAADACRKKYAIDYNQQNMLPMIHLNFRVYFEQPESELDDDFEFYTYQERMACERATAIVALTQADLDALQRVIPANRNDQSQFILSPPIRSDIEAAAAEAETEAETISKAIHVAQTTSPSVPLTTPSISPPPSPATTCTPSLPPSTSSWVNGRKYITCCARVCQEKNILQGFVALMEKIGSERMASRGLVPLIFGRQTSPDYAATCIARLRAAFPKPGACEIKPFGGPNEMANMWKQTRYVQNAKWKACIEYMGKQL